MPASASTKLVDQRGRPEVLRAVERQEREVGVVVASRDAGLAEPIPDARHRRHDEGVGDAVGGGGVGVEAVRVGGGQDAGEPVVADREVIDELAGERQVLPGVVAEREVVVAAAPEPVARPAVELDPSAVVGVGRISEAAAGEAGEVVRGVGDALLVEVGQPGLASGGAGHPAEVVVEGTVLHAHHDDVVETGRLRVGQRSGPARERVAHAAAPQAGRGQAGQELTAAGHTSSPLRSVGSAVCRTDARSADPTRRPSGSERVR